MQLVLDTSGLIVTKDAEAFTIKSEKGKRVISPAKLSSIAITANIMISASAVKLAIKNKIPILFFDYIGKAKARLWSPYFESIATLRRQQVHFCESPEATAFIIDLFLLKKEGQIENLRFLKRHSTRISNALNVAISSIQKATSWLRTISRAIALSMHPTNYGRRGKYCKNLLAGSGKYHSEALCLSYSKQTACQRHL